MMAGKEIVGDLLDADPGDEDAILNALSPAELARLDGEFPAWAHAGQEPPGDDWRVWVMMAGRGFGKTRAGAEWLGACARADGSLRIALVAASIDEARAVMVEGPSGLLAVARPGERAAMRWQPSRRRLVFASGAEARLFSGAHPAKLRGPEHHIAWCDELAKWARAQEAWDTLLLGLRAGPRPRALVTTTPIGGPLLPGIIGAPDTVLTGGATRANPHLPDAFVGAVEGLYAGTRLGRQELDGELLHDVEGALWPLALIERCRATPPDAEAIRRVVVGVDPPASAAGTCGIVVCALDGAGRGLVLADRSVSGASPDGWARAVAGAAAEFVADRVIAEGNQGGDMVTAVLRGADAALPVSRVHASRGKVARAEPVAAAFERGEAWFAGVFPALERELAGLVTGGAYQGPGASPDRADAMVWALWALLPQGRPEARVRAL